MHIADTVGVHFARDGERRPEQQSWRLEPEEKERAHSPDREEIPFAPWPWAKLQASQPQNAHPSQGVGNNFPQKGPGLSPDLCRPHSPQRAGQARDGFGQRTCPVTAALSLCEQSIQLCFTCEVVSCLDNGRGEAGPDSDGQTVHRLQQQVGREAGGREAGRHFPQTAPSRQPLGMGWA